MRKPWGKTRSDISDGVTLQTSLRESHLKGPGYSGRRDLMDERAL